MTRRTGSCLCGAVTVSGEFADTILACHCKQCQTWTGGGPFYTVRTKGDLTIAGQDATTIYHASAWGERVTCATCGAALWWKMQGKPIHSVAAGLFAGQDGFAVAEEIFTDHRPGWLPAHERAAQSTEAEEFAKLDAYLKEHADDHV